MRKPQFWLSATLCSVLFLIGCESTQSTGGLAKAKTDFDAHRYKEARQEAVSVLKISRGTDRQDAAYLAGLSAYKLDDMNEAETYFIIAINSSNRKTSGNAKAMLGLIRLNQKRHLEAAQLFKEAASSLEGSDSKQAAQHVAIAFEAAGDFGAADRWMQLATNPNVRSNSYSDSSGYESPSEFVLQVGAFRDRDRADRAASDADSLGRSRSLGPARVIPQRDDRGRNLYVVQIGSFTTRRQATQARTELGNLEYIVTSVGNERLVEASQPLGYQ
ncbi:MAG: SPOR domain-containing protein [Planctomycetota bacterium]|nr:SPOR domain-containing protein [Planctomycetota bacterium]